MHWRTAAEKVIGTFKNHFKSILAGMDRTFPMCLCDRLVPQAESTLNMIWKQILHPQHHLMHTCITNMKHTSDGHGLLQTTVHNNANIHKADAIAKSFNTKCTIAHRAKNNKK